MRRAITIGVATMAVLGMFVAGAFLFSPTSVVAQEDTGETPTETVDEAKVRTTVEDVLADLVEDGVITAEQADAVAEALRENLPKRHHHRGFGFGLDIEATLGITPQELMEALQDGQTIAEIAEANGVDLDAVLDEALENIQTHLDEAVESGRLDVDEVDEKLADIQERITDFINGELPEGFGEGRFGRGFGPRGFGPPAEDAGASA